MNEQFETLKQETEADLGREIDADELHYLKGLYYFGLGLKLKAKLDAMSEPKRIGPIAERVLAEIDHRRRDHRHGIIVAVGSFLSGRSKRMKQRRAGKQKTETRSLWER